MNPEQIRRQIDTVSKQRADAEQKLAAARRAQNKKEASAASYRAKAAKATSDSMARSQIRQAEGAQAAALSEGRKGAELSKKIAGYATKEANLNNALSTALQRERTTDERARKRQEADDARARARLKQAEGRARARERAADRAHASALVSASEIRLTRAIDEIRAPRVEKLRILYATSASRGDLRVDKEIRRVLNGVKAATHRDLVDIRHLAAATAADLLNGISEFNPHVVHFSGHANENVLVFDTEALQDNPGQTVSAELFARMLRTVDKPPLLAVLNACKSAAQLDHLLGAVPMAIGMGDSIGDPDAMSFAARFYTSIANGQSVQSAFDAARIQMELDGMHDSDLPVLAHRNEFVPGDQPLVIPPE